MSGIIQLRSSLDMGHGQADEMFSARLRLEEGGTDTHTDSILKRGRSL